MTIIKLATSSCSISPPPGWSFPGQAPYGVAFSESLDYMHALAHEYKLYILPALLSTDKSALQPLDMIRFFTLAALSYMYFLYNSEVFDIQDTSISYLTVTTN